MALPATVAARERDCDAQRRLAVQWVEKNGRKIRGRAAKFQRYSPYDMEDFLQQAYVTALTAADISQARNISFEACFWILFSAESRMMASNPVTRNCFEEFRENYAGEGFPPTVVREFSQASWEENETGEEDPEMTDELMGRALSIMTPRQRDVWRYLLTKKNYSILEIAKAMNVTRQVVEQLREAGLQRVRRYFEEE